MRSLLLFIGKYHAFFLFLILEALCVTIIVQNNWFQQAQFSQTSQQIVGVTFGARNWCLEFFSLREVNSQLAAENARLKTIVEGNENLSPDFKYDATRLRFEGLSYIVKDTIRRSYKSNDTLPARDTMLIIERRPKYQFESARVINSTTNHDDNYLTINKGLGQNIKNDMVAISSHGLVGLINNTTENFATIIPIIHSKFAISAKVKINDIPGTIVWQGGDPHFATMKFVPKHAAAFIQPGDTIVTRGSLLYPENIPIGVVHSSKANEKDNFASITILISTDFTTINHVYIMRNQLLDEQRSIEVKNSKIKPR